MTLRKSGEEVIGTAILVRYGTVRYGLQFHRKARTTMCGVFSFICFAFQIFFFDFHVFHHLLLLLQRLGFLFVRLKVRRRSLRGSNVLLLTLSTYAVEAFVMFGDAGRRAEKNLYIYTHIQVYTSGVPYSALFSKSKPKVLKSIKKYHREYA